MKIPNKLRPNFFRMLAWSTLLLYAIVGKSQTLDTVFTCQGTFMDEGGATGDYLSNQHRIITYCPEQDGFSRLQLYALDLAPGDFIKVFDGADTTAPLLKVLNSQTQQLPYTFQAAAQNNSHCLTLQFFSDAQGTAAGWEGSISCVDSCQTIIGRIRASEPGSDAQGYIDICPGERIFFSGDATYPENNTFYEHSNENVTFLWDFGDGQYGTGPEVSHTYTEPGGYLLRMQVRDPFGCENANTVIRKIRVSPGPEFSFTLPELGPVCIGDTVTLSSNQVGFDPSSTINISPGTGQFSNVQYQNVEAAIPDGSPFPLVSDLIITGFTPGQRLEDARDLRKIGIDIEHSRLEDLSIRLECPNGQYIDLQQSPGLSITPTFLGAPVIGDEGRVQPGKPKRYFWDPVAGQSTWMATIDSLRPTTLPAGSYLPADAFSNLEGCPLNGNWTLSIQDSLVTSNGFLFNWQLDFADQLYPNLETFEQELLDAAFVFNPTMIDYQYTSVQAIPETAGYQFYKIEVSDIGGCQADTAFRVAVLPENAPECSSCEGRYQGIPDTFICAGQSLDLSIEQQLPEELLLTFSSNPGQRLGFANFPPISPYRAPLLVQRVAQDSLTNPIFQIESVCLNIDTDFNEDLAIYLEAPNGQLLELSTHNGGSSDNYTGTCFTPTAFNQISMGSAPFKGDFSPEGNWSDLQGAPVNGTWHLLVSDAFDAKSFGEMVDWEMTFRSINELDITWTPGDGLSCTDCPTPSLSPESTTTYQVVLEDGYGCTFQDEFTVTVYDTFPAPELICGPLSPGKMIFNWNPVPGANGYLGQITINGQDSVLPAPLLDTFLIIEGLTFGDEVGLQLSANPPFEEYFCQVGTSFSSCFFDDCFTFTQIGSITDVQCYGAATGSVQINVLRGFEPFTFYLNGDFIGQSDNAFTGLTAGDYQVVAEDKTGCSDTLSFSISEPPPILNEIQQIDSIACFGDSTASIEARATGGTGMLSLSWNIPVPDNSTFLDGLPAGTYLLSTEDESGCVQEDAITIEQPSPITLGAQLTAISCNGNDNGSIRIQPTGGTGQLAYQWSTGINYTELSNLPPGVYAVVVTDEEGCTIDSSFQLIEPSALSVDTTLITPVSCFGGSDGTATVLLSGGTTPYQYYWLDSLSQRQAKANNLPGGPVDIRVVDDRGCQISQTLQVPEPDPLVVYFEQVDVSCINGQDGALTALPQGGTLPYRYNWSTNSSAATINQLSAGIYSLTLTDSNHCSTTTSTTVNQPESELLLNARQLDQGCFGEQQNQAIVRASGGGESYTYLWSDGQTAATAVGLDSTTYQVSVTDNYGCTRSTSVQLEDLPPMNANMIINSPSCFGDSDGAIGINFIVGRENANLETFQFQWSTGQTGQTISNLVGDSLYTVTVTDTKGCQVVESRLVRQPRLITFDLAVENTSCYGAQDGSIEVMNIIADTDNFQYQWDSRAANQSTKKAVGLAAGAYSVTVTDNLGCSNFRQADLEQPTAITVSYDVQDNNCFGDLSGAVSAAVEGGTPGYRYHWSTGDSVPALEQLPAGIYTLSVTDQHNCLAVSQAVVAQPEVIQLGLATQDVNCHGGSDGSIVVNTSGGAPPYLYRVNQESFRGSPLIIGLAADTYTITVRDGNACQVVTRATIGEPPPFKVAIGAIQNTIALGDSLELTAVAQNGQGDIFWEWVEPFPDALNCLTCESITVQPAYTVSYELIGIDSAGCQDNDFVTIFVQKEQVIAVPTGFSPNNDGNNDQLWIHGEPEALINFFRVYDRQGALIYEIHNQRLGDLTEGWNGLFNGQPMAADTYVWYLEATFDEQITKVFRGTTTLIR